MNRGRGRGGRAPSTPNKVQSWRPVGNRSAAVSSSQSWRPVGNRSAATPNEASPVSASGNSSQEPVHHVRSEQKEVLELNADISRVQLVNKDTKHFEDTDVSPSTASHMKHSSNDSRKSAVPQDCTSPGSSNSVDGHAKLLSPMDKITPFDICLSSSIHGIPVLNASLLTKNREKRNQMKRSKDGVSGDVLWPGMVLLKSYLSIDDQVKVVKLCRDLGMGPGGFYQPGYRDGAKLNLRMMCLGKNWDPETSSYGEKRPTDGATPPKIPDEFNQFVENAIKDSHDIIKQQSWEPNVEKVLPSMKPDICIVNFYSSTGRLGLHQDRDESESSLKQGLPVVSFSIGDTAEFLYSSQRDVAKAEKLLLESGDVLVFGGESRHIFHGVSAIVKETAPKSMIDESKLRPGRLNLTFRQY